MLPNPFLEQEIARLIHTAQQFLTILQSILSVGGPIVFALLFPKIKQRIQNMNKDNAQRELTNAATPGAENRDPFVYEWGNQLGKRFDSFEENIKERFDTERRLTREGLQGIRELIDRISTDQHTLKTTLDKHGKRLDELEKPKS